MPKIANGLRTYAWVYTVHRSGCHVQAEEIFAAFRVCVCIDVLNKCVSFEWRLKCLTPLKLNINYFLLFVFFPLKCFALFEVAQLVQYCLFI